MSTQTVVSFEEYLALERSTAVKHQYLDGEIFAMGGASRRHTLVVTNVGGELRQILRERPCEVHTADLRVRTGSGLNTYPDVVVVCDDPHFLDEELDTLLNPVLIVEVLSKSTSDFDRGGKFAHYRTIDSLQHYFLVDPKRCHVEHFARQANGSWLLTELERMEDSVAFAALGIELRLSEVYHKVRFDK